MGINTRVLSGFMELLPQEQIEFDRLKSLIAESFHSYGYTSLDTPVIERSEVLGSKGGAETDKQTYFVTNGLTAAEPGQLALRFDLTVPFARYVVEHMADLSFPFKRAHIGKSYRGERPQKGRFREFYQCDIDVIGKNTLNIFYDAEVAACIYKLFVKMDIGKFTVRISNRRLLAGLLAYLGLGESTKEVMRLIDKAEKISEETLIASFKDLGLHDGQVESIKRFMGIKGSVEFCLDSLMQLGIKNEQFQQGLDELKTVTGIMADMGCRQEFFAIDLSIARGLDYYTGTVYETTLDDTPIGSICGGGRYDDLAGQFTSEKLPGVGASIGLTRLFWQLREVGLLRFQRKTIADCVVVPENADCMAQAFAVSNKLQELGINTDIFYDDVPMKKKFQYVTKKDTPYTIVARGEDFSFQYKLGCEFVKEILPIDELLKKIGGALCKH